MYDIIIIGAGPAGLTSAIYSAISNKKVLVLEAKSYGGKIINAHEIRNYPSLESISGFEFATKLYKQVKDLGVDIIYEKVVDIKDYSEYKEVTTNKNTYKSKTIIIATGSENRKLGLENEDELVGKGISYCATCDGSFYKDKVVGVIGGGQTALDDALYLSDIVEKVYLIHRDNSFKVDFSIDELNKHNNIEIIFNTSVTKINGKEKLESITINENHSTKTLNIDGLFIAVGQIPENQNFAKLIKLDKNGYVIA